VCLTIFKNFEYRFRKFFYISRYFEKEQSGFSAVIKGKERAWQCPDIFKGQSQDIKVVLKNKTKNNVVTFQEGADQKHA
jgi:hypothetical protein